MSIQVKNKHFLLETENTTLILREYCGFLEQVYYGAKIPDYNLDYLRNDQIFGFCSYDKNIELRYIYAGAKYEYSGDNTGDGRLPALNVIDENGFIGCRLKYKGFELVNSLPQDYDMPAVRGLEKGIKITLFDEEKGISADLYYFIAEDCDVICRFARINNDGESKISLVKAASLQLDFENPDFEAITYSGCCGSEFRVERQNIFKGKYEISSCAGLTGHASNPFFALCSRGATENYGECYAFNLIYSGNFKNVIECDERNFLRVLCGINDKNFNWTLEKGESFYTPQAVMTFGEQGFGGISRNFHKLIRERILPPQFNKPAPIVANTWESFGFNITQEKFVKFAEKAALAGADTVVLDDGWFRSDDKSGLGDWVLCKEKFAGGIAACVSKLNELNLNFGIWFEPEMISENSALYKTHPDWVLNNGNEGSLSRNQYVLDLTNPAVVDYITALLTAFLSHYPVTYLKWDENRYISEAGSKYTKNQGEVWHRYVLGLYEVFERITKKFPNVWIEGCAGGGGRFDAGMLHYTSQIWCSDDTDAIERLKIQYGTSFAYPVSAVGSHVSACPNHQTGRIVPFESRATVAMAGTFGYELDPAKLSEEEKQQIQEQIAEFKKYYDVIHFGNYYRLTNAMEEGPYAAWEFAKEDGSEALVSVVASRVRTNDPGVRIKLRGLKENQIYLVNGEEYPGGALMHGGLLLEEAKKEYQSWNYHIVMK